MSWSFLALAGCGLGGFVVGLALGRWRWRGGRHRQRGHGHGAAWWTRRRR